MPAQTDKAPAGMAPIPVSRDAVLEQFGQMLAAVPLAQDDDGSGIIADVMMATSWESLNTQTELPEAQDFLGQKLLIRNVERRESTLADGESPWYLVVTGELPDRDRAPFTFGTSARTIMAQLVKAYMHDWLPLLAVVERKDTATRSGRYPLNLRVIGKG